MYGLTQVLFAFAQYTLYDNIKTASRFDLDWPLFLFIDNKKGEK